MGIFGQMGKSDGILSQSLPNPSFPCCTDSIKLQLHCLTKTTLEALPKLLCVNWHRAQLTAVLELACLLRGITKTYTSRLPATDAFHISRFVEPENRKTVFENWLSVLTVATGMHTLKVCNAAAGKDWEHHRNGKSPRRLHSSRWLKVLNEKAHISNRLRPSICRNVHKAHKQLGLQLGQEHSQVEKDTCPPSTAHAFHLKNKMLRMK